MPIFEFSKPVSLLQNMKYAGSTLRTGQQVGRLLGWLLGVEIYQAMSS